MSASWIRRAVVRCLVVVPPLTLAVFLSGWMSPSAWAQGHCEQAQLHADDGVDSALFGSAVAYQQGTAVIGAPGHDSTGAVFVR